MINAIKVLHPFFGVLGPQFGALEFMQLISKKLRRRSRCLSSISENENRLTDQFCCIFGNLSALGVLRKYCNGGCSTSHFDLKCFLPEFNKSQLDSATSGCGHTYAACTYVVYGITVSFYSSIYIAISTSVLQHPFLICIFLFAVHILCQIDQAGILSLRMRRQSGRTTN